VLGSIVRVALGGQQRHFSTAWTVFDTVPKVVEFLEGVFSATGLPASANEGQCPENRRDRTKGIPATGFIILQPMLLT